MARFKIYGYKPGSASAKNLAEHLDTKVLKHVGSKYRPRIGDTVVNWGSHNIPGFGPAKVLNKDVRSAGNKLTAFQVMKGGGVNVPEFWTNKEDIPADAYPVVCRKILNGHSGAGIVIADTVDELVPAPLYTKYVKKKEEYRVHVYGEEVFFIQRKARVLDNENPNWRVRNLEGGFVFAKEEQGDVPLPVLEQAKKAVKALGLDFGGCDVIWNHKEQKAYVLEVNTACGLEARTAEAYAEVIRNV